MIDRLLQTFATHHCYGCGEAGALLCANCKYDITQEAFSACIAYVAPAGVGICSGCKTNYERAWCVGDRSGTLAGVMDAYKFKRARAAHRTLAMIARQPLDNRA